MPRQSILAIEDERCWLRLLSRILGGAGFDVHLASTCAEGIRLAELYKPDCIVSDFHLPDGDAVSVCAGIRSNENIKNTPIIIFSSDPGAEIEAYTQCQANAFLLKGEAAVTKLPAIIKKVLLPSLKEQ